MLSYAEITVMVAFVCQTERDGNVDAAFYSIISSRFRPRPYGKRRTMMRSLCTSTASCQIVTMHIISICNYPAMPMFYKCAHDHSLKPDTVGSGARGRCAHGRSCRRGGGTACGVGLRTRQGCEYSVLIFVYVCIYYGQIHAQKYTPHMFSYPSLTDNISMAIR